MKMYVIRDPIRGMSLKMEAIKKKEKDLSDFSFTMIIINVVSLIFLGLILSAIFITPLDVIVKIILSTIIIIPIISIIFSMYLVRNRMDGYTNYFCEYCQKDFTAIKPDRDHKQVYCYRCGTKIDTPEHFIKGRIFEQKVKERFERSEGFEIISETPRYEDKNTHAKKYPDLRVQYFYRDKFFVEVKFRGNENNVKLKNIITKDLQLHRFTQFKRDYGEEVYYYLGIGGLPEDPDKVFVVPIEQLITHLKNDRDLQYLESKGYKINFKSNVYYRDGKLY